VGARGPGHHVVTLGSGDAAFANRNVRESLAAERIGCRIRLRVNNVLPHRNSIRR